MDEHIQDMSVTVLRWYHFGAIVSDHTDPSVEVISNSRLTSAQSDSEPITAQSGHHT